MFYRNLITYRAKIWYCRYWRNTRRCISSVWDVNSELPHLIVFSSREILQLICFDESTADYYFITRIVAVAPSNCEFLVGSCYVIDLQVSLVCPRSFICLRYVPASVAGNESFVTMYFRFSAVRGDRGHWMETSRGIAICAKRVMHTRRQEEKIATVCSIALEASTCRIYRVSTYTDLWD